MEKEKKYKVPESIRIGHVHLKLDGLMEELEANFHE